MGSNLKNLDCGLPCDLAAGRSGLISLEVPNFEFFGRKVFDVLFNLCAFTSKT